MAAVSAELANSGLPRAHLLRFQFDPVNTFGSEGAVARLLASSSGETASFWVNEFAEVADTRTTKLKEQRNE